MITENNNKGIVSLKDILDWWLTTTIILNTDEDEFMKDWEKNMRTLWEKINVSKELKSLIKNIIY